MISVANARLAEPRFLSDGVGARIELRRYIAGDALLITPRAAVAHEFDSMDEALKVGAPPGLAWTLQESGMPIGCGGLFECGKGRWLAWTWVGEIPAVARRAVFDACTVGIWTAIRTHGARRIESHVPVSMPVARRFNERLGFICEGVATAWGPDGSDYWTMAFVPGATASGAALLCLSPRGVTDGA